MTIPLVMTFVDFVRAFDSADREVIWKLMHQYRFLPKITSVTKQLYEDSNCQIIHNGKLTQPFAVRTGVRQGCMLSPIIFLIVIDWIMRRTTSECDTGLQWTTNRLEDLDFADDICLLSHNRHDAQTKLERLAEEARKTGLRINTAKTEVMRINTEHGEPLMLSGCSIKDTDRFTYLGSVVTVDGGAVEDVGNRINKARLAFNALRPIWRTKALSMHSKIRIFNSNVKAVLLYGSETWRVTTSITRKLQVFVNRCLRFIVDVRWPDKISNVDLWARTNQKPIDQEIRRRKWGWIGHTLRKPADNTAQQALDWNPQGKRKIGRPKTTWRRSVESEARRLHKSWSDLKRVAQNRNEWRSVVAALCSKGS